MSDEDRILAGARRLAARFVAVADRRAHLAIVDDPNCRKQIDWLRRHRRELWEQEVRPVIKASWRRTDPRNQQQGAML